ncbi:MAG: DUF3576 domain-containing protein [Paenirhodobacter sp.]|uniref:DUF3576 domain-containing protein n=1 Tax=Paenirhodobacter sp. TaxID=1965326 RepID=UPI003D10DF8F
MKSSHILRVASALGLSLALAGCGGISSGKLFGGSSRQVAQTDANGKPYPNAAAQSHLSGYNQSIMDANNPAAKKQSSVWDLFSNKDDPNITVEVNKYLWNASLEVLDFLPIQSVDPFSGLIVTGYGTPPGGGRAYKATIHITDPALDARSLKVSLESRGGSVSPDTVRAVEDAILTRARQLRIRDSGL